MEKITSLFIILLLIASCKPNKEQEINTDKTEDIASTKELARDQKVAHQAGLKAWDEVESIEFTFNVSKNSDTLTSRKWTWKPKTNDVQLMAKGETVTYNRNNTLDSIAQSADRAFVNDVYWLLPAYKLVWDKGTRVSFPKENLIQLEYTGDGGYTPGDRYDLTVDGNDQITSWSYYPKGSKEPAMTTTFENYKSYNGVRIAHDHKTSDGSLNIFFTDVKTIKTDN
jgi:hypothetical protein